MEEVCQCFGVEATFDPTATRHTGPYQHLCIVNENVFDLILSFLSSQTLTKLNDITGDLYPNCEPNLAQFCCGCENDNPKLVDDVCRNCQSEMDGYTPFIDKEVATSVYGLKVRDLVNVPQYGQLYHRVDLENYLIAKYGSKLGWLREISRRSVVEKTIEAMQQQEKEEREVFMASLAPGFPVYAQLINLEETNETLLLQSNQRFTALVAALKARGLQLRPKSKLCEQFIVANEGDIQDIVDTMEEMRFLNYCTDCPMQNSEEVKMELCISYLEDHRGLKLPRKWENCRSRFEEVQRTGGIPQCEVRYIYSE